MSHRQYCYGCTDFKQVIWIDGSRTFYCLKDMEVIGCYEPKEGMVEPVRCEDYEFYKERNEN